MEVKTLRFIQRGQVVQLHNVPPTRTLLQLVREDLGLTGTKEGCNEGDCGACTVVLGEPDGAGGLALKAVNSCIRLAHSIDGMALWTVQDIGTEKNLHPCQQAMVDCHGSQCGFCTPGFVMSLFALYENHAVGDAPTDHVIDRVKAQEALSGNLCRCTGYRPILDAAQRMHQYPVQRIDAKQVLSKYELLVHHSIGLEAEKTNKKASKSTLEGTSAYLQPTTLAQLLALRAQHPNAQLVAGCTDVGLWINKQHQQMAQIIDTTRVAELRRVERYPHHIAIGAAVTLHDAYAALVQDRPQLRDFASRFAGQSVRNSGTLGGNVANGSPIGDSMPLLIALGANVVLMSQRGHREMPLEKLYTGCRKNVMQPDEVLAWIKVPLPTADEFSRVYKISKRYDDDISAVCLGVSLRSDGERITSLSIGVGGVAATPVRAIKTEASCASFHWARGTLDTLKATLQAEFQPIGDMRASAAYRRDALGGLVERFWQESQGHEVIRLESLHSAALIDTIETATIEAAESV
jgi:xanthine dehydrogenase small subunit